MGGPDLCFRGCFVLLCSYFGVFLALSFRDCFVINFLFKKEKSGDGTAASAASVAVFQTLESYFSATKPMLEHVDLVSIIFYSIFFLVSMDARPAEAHTCPADRCVGTVSVLGTHRRAVLRDATEEQS